MRSTPLLSELQRRNAAPLPPVPRVPPPPPAPARVSLPELPAPAGGGGGWTPQAVTALILAALGALSSVVTPLVTRVDPPSLAPYVKRAELLELEAELHTARRQAGNAANDATDASSQLRAVQPRLEALERACLPGAAASRAAREVP